MIEILNKFFTAIIYWLRKSKLGHYLLRYNELYFCLNGLFYYKEFYGIHILAQPFGRACHIRYIFTTGIKSHISDNTYYYEENESAGWFCGAKTHQLTWYDL